MKNLSDITIKVYTTEDVAEMFITTREAIRHLIKSGKLMAKQTGSNKTGYLIFDNDLQDFMDKYPRYRKKYDTFMTANKVTNSINVKETNIKDFVLEFLYGVIPYENYKKLEIILDMKSNIARIISVRIEEVFIKDYITKESWEIVKYVIYNGCKEIKKEQQVKKDES